MANLFIPGPTDVHPEVLASQSHEMIGHRSQACAELIARVQPKLQLVFGTQQSVFISTSSGTGLQEASVRNCVGEKLLLCSCGAFGERWFAVADQNGIPVEHLRSEWGQANSLEEIEQTLQAGTFDAIAIVHNETSTGIENPIQDIAALARNIHPDIIVLVDAVSSAGGVKILADAWGLDVVFTSSQKCLALPPGLAFASVSKRALEKATTIKNRGWYFDFLLHEEFLQRHLTPTTPAISLLFALDAQLDRILQEGLERRYLRHQDLANRVQEWAQQHFSLFAQEGYRSNTVTTINNELDLNISELNKFLGGHNKTIANGYGKLKEETFRIGHMGELDHESLDELLALIESYRK